MKSWHIQHAETVQASCLPLALPEMNAEEFGPCFRATLSKFYSSI